jgi:hypothetical protein
MTSFKNSLFASSLLAISLIADVEAAGPSIKVAISFPAGGAGLSNPKTLPSSTKISPCISSTQNDAAIFTVTYDATNLKSTPTARLDPLDLYVFFYNPDTIDATNKFYSISKAGMGTGIKVTPYADATAIQAAYKASPSTLDPYLAGPVNFNTTVATETLFGSAIRIDPTVAGSLLNTGTWELIGILADPTTFHFQNPSTWVAWDVAVLMFGMPWQGIDGSTATPVFTADLSTCL